ncbi:STAS domain-containing protein [Aureispira anguillae]|uniref:Anti-sigma factor antagonist n=1 Tax=Aureispira anguillae TaxID=2864201 RepID=A0A915YB20_9BACT|nr:STAS domain-containing protein [Aureispira anguillae]BDS09785.1 STAS domain-containing protein [Aureispira anguillae]
MEIVSTKHEDKLVLGFNGQLDTGTAPKVEIEVNKYLENNQKVIFNLEATTFVSSAGLRVFLGTAKKLKASGGLFRICNANDVVQEILDISGFSQILDIKGNLEEALMDF